MPHGRAASLIRHEDRSATMPHGVVAPGMIACQSRRYFNIVDPQASSIDFGDVAAALAKLCRFTGHGDRFYSVAQHSVLVRNNVPPRARRHALVHDAKEAFIGDWSTPLKQAVRAYDDGAARVLSQIEDGVDQAVHDAAGLEWPVPKDIADAIKLADLRALLTERNALGLRFGAPWPADAIVVPFDEPVVPLPPADAERLFRRALAAEGIGSLS